MSVLSYSIVLSPRWLMHIIVLTAGESFGDAPRDPQDELPLQNTQCLLIWDQLHQQEQRIY